jgi:large subunit ribosomal protein L7/L12
MSLSRAEVIAYLEGLSTLELSDLIDALQRRLGVTAVVPPSHVTMGAPTYVMGAPLETDDVTPPTHRVIVTAVGRAKVHILHALRQHVSLILSEAVHLLDSLPATAATGLSLPAAQALAGALREAGAEVEVQPAGSRSTTGTG